MAPTEGMQNGSVTVDLGTTPDWASDVHPGRHGGSGGVGGGGRRGAETCNGVGSGGRRTRAQSEYGRCVLSLIYAYGAMLMMAATVVTVQNRVFHMKNHPPLPDVVLDRFQYCEWALTACEICGVALLIIWAGCVMFNKNRVVLLRRTFYMMGNLYLLRVVTTFVTGIPLIDIHRHVHFKEYVSLSEKTARTAELAMNMALSITSKTSEQLTYGDYIFSGHILLVTLFSHFINRYSPKSMWWLRLLSFLMTVTAIVCILAAHGHYTVDVVIAVYVTTQYFLHYHSLLDNMADSDRGISKLHAVLFPFFTYFEQGSCKYTNNEYDRPLPLLKAATSFNV